MDAFNSLTCYFVVVEEKFFQVYQILTNGVGPHITDKIVREYQQFYVCEVFYALDVLIRYLRFEHIQFLGLIIDDDILESGGLRPFAIMIELNHLFDFLEFILYYMMGTFNSLLRFFSAEFCSCI